MKERYIAIVEDDRSQAELLTEYIERFGRENGIHFITQRFYSATMFESRERADFDIVFFDIELPDGNGMEIVRRMREKGNNTLVIFVTNLAQYAVKGYEVRAFDFVVKPVAYYNFAMKFTGALESLEINQDFWIWVTNKEGRYRLSVSRITFVEVDKHYITYHTLDGDFTALGTISAVADELKDAPFSFCNRCYFVNLKHVVGFRQTEVFITGNVTLQMSRHKKAGFVQDLNDYLSGKKSYGI